ncbi:hypothetical protein LEMLEM_LOCUS17621 [Lemmus lemmus]
MLEFFVWLELAQVLCMLSQPCEFPCGTGQLCLKNTISLYSSTASGSFLLPFSSTIPEL